MKSNPFSVICAGLLLMSIVPILSRNPLIYSDTKAYYMVGEQVFKRLVPSRHVAELKVADGSAPRGTASVDMQSIKPSVSTAAASPDDPRLAFTVAGARSPTFSVLLYAVTHLAGAWAWVALNVVIVTVSLYLLLDALSMLQYALPIFSILALVTGIPEMSAFLMPDIFTVTAVLSIMYFLVVRMLDKSSLFMAGVLAFSLSCHPTNLVIATVVLGVGLAAEGRFLPKVFAVGRTCLLVLSGCIILAAGVGAAYTAGVAHVERRALQSPPFLTARLYADGPGRDFALSRCQADPRAFEICRYLGQKPVTSNDLLWSRDPQRGVFELADYDSRVRLIGEQGRFVFGTLTYAPIGVAVSAVRNFITQLGYFQIDETYGSPRIYFTDPRFSLFRTIMPGGENCANRPERCEPWLDRDFVNGTLLLGILGSLGIIVWRFPRNWRDPSPGRRACIYAVLVVLANAAVCGVLSAPAERYQLRVNWLYEFVAVLCLAEWYAIRGATPRLRSR